MKAIETTFSSGLNDAYAYIEGKHVLGAGSFEIRFDNGVIWEVHIPEGMSKEDWHDQWVQATSALPCSTEVVEYESMDPVKHLKSF